MKFVIVFYGIVSFIDDVVRFVVVRVWMFLVGDKVLDMSVI